MGKRQHISFGIMIAHSGRVSHASQQRVASRCFERRIERHEQMLSVNAFWEACDENAWITS
jgi:hypothetical protein